MKALLDVNVLIALFDKNHMYHDITKSWYVEFAKDKNNVWLSCATTQMGCIRIMSTPSYPNYQKLQAVQQKLSKFVANSNHQFILSDIDLANSDLINWQHIQGNKQITDVYLMALAKLHNAFFVSLDNKISPIAIKEFNADNIITLL